MVTLLNDKDAFPRSQTTRLRLYNVHFIHDIGRHNYEVDAGISSGNSSQAALSKPLDSVIIASWKSVPCCASLFHYCGAWKSAGGTATSSWSRNFRRSTARLMETARSRQNNARYRSVKYQLRSFHLGEPSSYPQMSTPSISLEVPKKCFAGVFLTVPYQSH